MNNLKLYSMGDPVKKIDEKSWESQPREEAFTEIQQAIIDNLVQIKKRIEKGKYSNKRTERLIEITGILFEWAGLAAKWRSNK